MKRILSIFILCMMVFTLSTSTVLASNNRKISVVVNGVIVKVNSEICKVDNIIYNGTTYVPLRGISELLNKDVSYDSKSKMATIKDKPYIYAVHPTDIKLAEEEVLKKVLKNDEVVDIIVKDGKMIILTDSGPTSNVEQVSADRIINPINKNIDVVMDSIKISINGKSSNTGNFVYGGVTYVQLRSISEMFNNKVTYDNDTKIVDITDVVGISLNEKIVYSNDVSPAEIVDRFSTANLSVKIEEALEELDDQQERSVDGIVPHDTKYSKIIGEWISTQQLDGKDISFTMTGVGQGNKVINYAFYSKSPYTNIYDINIPNGWDGNKITTNGIRVKKNGSEIEFYVDDLIEKSILKQR